MNSGDWRVRPAFSSTTTFDMVHVVIGRPGVILIGEGTPSRLRSMMGQEKRRLAKIIGSTELREFIVGNDEGQVPLPKLVKYVSKLKRRVAPADMTDLLSRLKAIDAARPVAPLPKGPVPTSMKGFRGQMRGR